MSTKKEDVLRITKNFFPKARNVRKVNKGYSHEIFEINTGKNSEKIILKVCIQDRKEEFSLKKEERIHEILEGIGITVPNVIIVDNSKKIVNKEFMICSKIPGKDLDTVWKKLEKKSKIIIAEKMGEMLGKIHDIKFKECGYLLPSGIKNDFKFKLKGKRKEELKINPASINIISYTLEDMGKMIISRHLSEKKLKKIFEYLIRNQKLAESKEKLSLIHGDYDLRNIRVKKINKKWEIVGLIDFEYSASMPKEYDFIKLDRENFFKNKEIKKSFFKGYLKYQKLPKDFEKRVKFMRTGRDISFAGVLLLSGNIKKADEVLKKVLKEVNKT